VTNQYANAVTIHDVATGAIVRTISGLAGANWVAITRDGTRALVTCPNTKTVAVIDTASSSVVATLPTGILSQSVAITPDGTRAYVINQYSMTATVVDVAKASILTTINRAGIYPMVVAMMP
jgi:YVTN family beta-propeller protein